MTVVFVLDPNSVYDVKHPDHVNPVWRIQDRKVYAYLEDDARRDWSGDIGILILCSPQRLVDHDGQEFAFIEGGNVRCVDGRQLSLIEAWV